jgi:nucleoid-associated protein YgaU
MSTDPDEIFVLALECRYTPKSPDPDSALSGVSPTTEARKYTVAKGDSLAKIASRFYGDRSQWRQIYEANRKVIGDDPAVIKPGQKLTIP